MKVPKIIETRSWCSETVKQCCIRNEMYTYGSNEDYERMLGWVNLMVPTVDNLYVVAKDIAERSEGQTITTVMFLLAREAIVTTFEIEG